MMFTKFLAGTVYHYCFHKEGHGQWNVWTDSISSEENIIPPGANVTVFVIQISAVTDTTVGCNFS